MCEKDIFRRGFNQNWSGLYQLNSDFVRTLFNRTPAIQLLKTKKKQKIAEPQSPNGRVEIKLKRFGDRQCRRQSQEERRAGSAPSLSRRCRQGHLRPRQAPGQGEGLRSHRSRIGSGRCSTPERLLGHVVVIFSHPEGRETCSSEKS